MRLVNDAGRRVLSAAAVWVLGLTVPPAATAQILEIVGSRALGMGGAFVAVANDSSATWWNPAGLADGPFVDMAIARNVLDTPDGVPGRREVASGFALGTPPFGVSYYRLRLTKIRAADSTGPPRADREDRRGGTTDSLAVSQFGATFIQTLIPGIHAATTLKFVRGTTRRGDLAAGDAVNRFDLDAGVIAVLGAVRLGVVGRNLREVEFDGMELPRQVRVGAAFDAEALDGMPLTVALDADLRRYPTGTGDRRVVAFGAERWFRMRRVGVRGGARFNTVGAGDRAVTAGMSVALRPGVFVDGHGVGGSDERGWGLAARISF